MEPLRYTFANSSDEKAVSDVKIDSLQHDGYGSEANTDVARSHNDRRGIIDDGFDAQEIKKTMRKVDWRLVPILSALYAVSLIDRANLSLARAAGMDKALGLNRGDRYSITVVTFFVSKIQPAYE